MKGTDHLRESLYAGILAEPEDDAPRLVYADWLEEHGDAVDQARAEFIRLQCRLARMDDWDEGHVEAKLRADRLLAEHGAAWVSQATPSGVAVTRKFKAEDYERGFPSRLRFSDAYPEDEVRGWFARLPITRAVFSYGRDMASGPSVRLLTDPGLAGRIRDLSLAGGFWGLPDLVDVAYRALARATQMSNLRRLEVWDSPGPVALGELLAAPHSSRLTGLALGSHYQDQHYREVATAGLPALMELRVGRRLAPASAIALAGAEWAPRLTALDLSANEGLGDAGLTALLGGQRLARLRTLVLGRFDLGEGAWATLAECAPPSLVRLAYGGTFPSPSALLRLAQGAYRLEHLHIRRGFASGDGKAAGAFFAGPALARLRRLDWIGNQLGEDGMVALARAPFRESLRVLVLMGRNHLTDRGVRELCHGPPWPHLAHLDLKGNHLSPEVALELLEHPNLARLTSLSLTVGRNGHTFVERLARSPSAARLRGLGLYFDLTSGAIEALVESPYLEGLDGLDVSARTAEKKLLQARFGARMGGAVSWTA